MEPDRLFLLRARQNYRLQEFGQKTLLVQRKAIGRSRSKIARIANVDPSRIYRYEENGEAPKDLATVQLLAEAYQLNADQVSEWCEILWGINMQATHSLLLQSINPVRDTRMRWHGWVDSVRSTTPTVARDLRDKLETTNYLEDMKIVAQQINLDYKRAGPSRTTYNRWADLNAKSLTYVLAYLIPESASIQSKRDLSNANYTTLRDAPEPWRTFFQAVESRIPDDPYCLSVEAILHTMFTSKWEYHGKEYKLLPPLQAIEYIWHSDRNISTRLACVSVAMMCINAAIIMEETFLKQQWKSLLQKMWMSLINMATIEARNIWERFYAIKTLEFINICYPLVCAAAHDGKFVYIPTSSDYVLRYPNSSDVPADAYFTNFFEMISQTSSIEYRLTQLLTGIHLMQPLEDIDPRWQSIDEVVTEFVLEQPENRFAHLMTIAPYLAEIGLVYIYGQTRHGKSVEPATVLRVADTFGINKSRIISLQRELDHQLIRELLESECNNWQPTPALPFAG